jgi:hypothetical protein
MGGAESGKAPKGQNSGYKDRFWIPRFWDGIGVRGWFSLLARNRFDVSPRRVAMAVLISGFSFINSALWLLQAAVFGRKIEQTELPEDPIFVIGHWRAGTTLLHELLVLDSRHTYPDTYACFAPNHFLVSGWFFRPTVGLLMPSRRPMDNMAAGWDRPQEDEFALCNIGARSPYLTIAFPNRPPQDQDYLDFRGVPAAEVDRWKRSYHWFLKCLTLKNRKRIVVKFPGHTARVRTLLEMFPKAKFLHIVRNPYVLFPSTVNLWKRLYRDEGLQMPNYRGLDRHVFETLTRMYEAFDRDRPSIPPGQFCEVRYEQLVADPLGQMKRVYEQLQLGGFDGVRPAMEAYFAKEKDYKTNRYEMPPEVHAEITRRWSKYIEDYGYAGESPTRNLLVAADGPPAPASRPSVVRT